MQTAPRNDAVPPASFRKAMGAFATGIAILTTEFRGAKHGMTVNSLTSVSLEPSILLICLRHGSDTAEAVRHRGEFGINILSREQESLSRQFCGPIETRFSGVGLARDETGIPFIESALAHMRCRLRDVYDCGDHEVFFGLVDYCASIEGPPLVFLGGRIGTFGQ